MVVGLHHVQVSCPGGGEAAARAFYGSLLEMVEMAKPPGLADRGGAWFRSGSAELHVGVDPDFRPAAKAHPALLVDDLDAVCGVLAAAGVAAAPDDLLPGYRRAYVLDPFGNRLELVQPLSCPLDPGVVGVSVAPAP